MKKNYDSGYTASGLQFRGVPAPLNNLCRGLHAQRVIRRSFYLFHLDTPPFPRSDRLTRRPLSRQGARSVEFFKLNAPTEYFTWPTAWRRVRSRD